MKSLELYQDRPEFPDVVEMAHRAHLESERDKEILAELSGIRPSNDEILLTGTVTEAFTTARIPLFFRALDDEIEAGDYSRFVGEAIDSLPSDTFVEAAHNSGIEFDHPSDVDFVAHSLRTTVRSTFVRGSEMVGPLTEEGTGDYIRLYETAKTRSANYEYPAGIAFRNPVLFEDIVRTTYEPEEFATKTINRLSYVSGSTMRDMIIGAREDVMNAQREFEEAEQRAKDESDEELTVARLLARAITKNLVESMAEESYRQQAAQIEALRHDANLKNWCDQYVERTKDASVVAMGGEVVRFWGQNGFDGLSVETRAQIERADRRLTLTTPDFALDNPLL